METQFLLFLSQVLCHSYQSSQNWINLINGVKGVYQGFFDSGISKVPVNASGLIVTMI